MNDEDVDSLAPLPPALFSRMAMLNNTEEEGSRAALAAKGVRLLPFGFASAVAVVSDVDSSKRVRYDQYVGWLVDRLGLDFGDSTWLQWQYSVDTGRGNGFGFFSRNLTFGSEEAPEVFIDTRTFAESVAEYHKGNVDHFHAFYGRGPRVSIADHLQPAGEDTVAFEPAAFQAEGRWSCDDLAVMGVVVVGRRGEPLMVRGVTVIEQDGAVTEDFTAAPHDGPADGRRHSLFLLRRAVDDERRAPRLNKVRRVVVELGDGGERGAVERLLLINAYGDLVLERLRLLQDAYNVEAALVTEHAAYHFRNPGRMEEDEALLKAHVATYRGPVEAYHGALFDDEGDLVFTTDADHPNSICRVFPGLSRDLETRFIVPQASLGPLGFTPFRLVTPSPTRSGGGVYWARRVLPADVPPPGAAPEKLTRHETFCRRLGGVLDRAEETPGLFWPFYTHLGGLVNRFAGEQVPSPYFDAEPLHRLQDSAFNISGTVKGGARTWFTRGTVIYDYALMLRAIEPRLERPDPDTVWLRSWFDPVLGKTMPRSKAQLYGLTFYVYDPARAEIRLDGEKIETIVTNGPDEAGRLSVTIAECDLRFSLFHELDPLADVAGGRLENGTWTWRDPAEGERAFGRLEVGTGAEGGASARASAALTIPMHGWTAPGAQLVSLWVRRSRGALFGLVVETQTGGRFYFGDRQLEERCGPGAIASYRFDSPSDAEPRWRRSTAPFHDLAWSAGATPGAPLPNHPLASITLVCGGPPGASVDLAQMEFLRPRTSAGSASDKGFCLGGQLAPFEPGVIVRRARRDGVGATISAAVDQRGFFCFEQTPRGVYAVWAETPQGRMIERRGPFVEVVSDNMSLVLDRLVAGGAGSIAA